MATKKATKKAVKEVAKPTKPVLPKLVTTKSAFREFLEASRKKSFVVGDADKCAVARFLNSQLPNKGGLYASVDGNTIDIFDNKSDDSLKTLKTPVWMSDFIDKFDKLAETDEKVTGATVLDSNIL